VARSTKTAAAPPTPVGAKRRIAIPVVAPEPTQPAKTKAALSKAAAAPPKAAATRAKPSTAAVPAAVRIPPPSKGELRAHIEKLEAANATLKAKSREANRAAKLATRRIAELEEQVGQLQEEATKVATPVAPVAGARTVRRGRPPGRKTASGSGDAVPPGVTSEKVEPLYAEAEAARDGLEENLPGKQSRGGD
jgi:hypothetical protein